MSTEAKVLQYTPGSQDLLLNLVNNLDAMLAYWDKDQVCRFANDACLQWFGVKSEKLIGRMTMKDLLGSLYEQNLPYIKAALAGQVQTFDTGITAPGGDIRYSQARYIPHIVDGEIRGVFMHLADVSHVKKLQDELKAAREEAGRFATHDFLTGLPNRVMLFDRITQALALSKRTGQIVAGMTLNLDDFKRVNDTYGHDIGDLLLTEIASRLTSGLREYDSVTRLGGDEFFILVPLMSTRVQVEVVAAHIMSSIKAPFQLDGAAIYPTCSIGIALSSPDIFTPESLITNSDQALHEAKKLGKNRFAFYH